ncbi:hypothetical protein ACP70R_023301 [Stipagrostis hirtigluma subsp. patula]
MADQPADCSRLPAHLLELIADKTRDAVNGVTLFRSVCPAWRAAAGEAPRLLPPVPRNSPTTPPRAGSEHELVFPLARGWSIVVDVRDTSCRLWHLATGATAALPNLNAVRATAASAVERRRYEFFGDAAPDPTMSRPHMFYIELVAGGFGICLETYIQFSETIRFAVHIPPGSPAGTTDGMVIIMYHMVQGLTGLVFWRPGDAAWTALRHPDDDAMNFVDFAYLDGKMFAMDKSGVTTVFDTATLDALHRVDVPAETTNFTSVLFPSKADIRHCLHLVALPGRLLVVRIRVRSGEPESFDVFELGPDGTSWRKVIGDGGIGCDLFLDGHHATFGGGGVAGGGNRIYYVHVGTMSNSAAAYCYSMEDGTLECVYRRPEDSDCEYSTNPSWFVP